MLVASQQLVDAAPGQWATSLSRVLEYDRDGSRNAMAAALVAELDKQPEARGAQAAIAALGALGGKQADNFLLETLADRGDLAVDAAIALGAGPSLTRAEPLIDVANDPLAPATLRAACAASLLRHGQGQQVALLIRAVLLAGSPSGNPLLEQLGLPRKSRWAHERYLIQTALLAVAGDDFGLDTDASWPDLKATADRVSAWLESGQ